MADTAGKYLVFALDQERYGVPIAKVREVMQFVPVTPVHEASSFLRGVINLRGRIIPIETAIFQKKASGDLTNTSQ
jgi:purine-binding chemotaxis protein CheW